MCFVSIHSHFSHFLNRPRAKNAAPKAKVNDDKLKRMMDEVDALLESSSSEKEDTQGGDSASDVYDDDDNDDDF
jgi:hypothetical protein